MVIASRLPHRWHGLVGRLIGDHHTNAEDERDGQCHEVDNWAQGTVPGPGLLPQPGGFEGFGPLVESFDVRDHSVAERPYEAGSRRDLDSIPTPEMPRLASDYTVAGVDQLIELGPDGSPRLKEASPHLPDLAVPR